MEKVFIQNQLQLYVKIIFKREKNRRIIKLQIFFLNKQSQLLDQKLKKL